jgi:hypothetical protein
MSAIVPAAVPINPYSYYSQPISGKLEVPVLASESLYAQFQFVQGVPTAEGGVSLDKLKVIDSLLAQINAHRGAKPPVKLDQNDLSSPDQTISRLSAQANDMQKNADAFHSWGQSRGLVFSLSA